MDPYPRRSSLRTTNYDTSSKGAYILCAFISSILLLAVGTFVTSHAFSEEQKDTVLVIIGPCVLVIGGVLMSGSVTICLIACYKNKDLNELELDDYLTIGASVFYNHGEYDYPDNGNVQAYSNPCVNPNTNEKALRFIADTVLKERQRKLSLSPLPTRHTEHTIPIHKSSSFASSANASNNSAGYFQNQMEFLPHNYSPMESSMDHLNQFSDDGTCMQQHLHRTRGTEALNQDKHDLNYYSPSLSSQASSKNNEDYKFHRSYTVAPKRRTNIIDQHYNAIDFNSHDSLRRGRSTIKRKKRKISKARQELKPEVHPLPSYTPEVISSLLYANSRPSYNRTLSNPVSLTGDHNLDNYDYPLASKNNHSVNFASSNEDNHRNYPGNPSPGVNRRPSIAMGVKGIKNRSQDFLVNKLLESSHDSSKNHVEKHQTTKMPTSDCNKDGMSDVIIRPARANSESSNRAEKTISMNNTAEITYNPSNLHFPPPPQVAAVAILQTCNDLIKNNEKL